jgi:hypothetical protein
VFRLGTVHTHCCLVECGLGYPFFFGCFGWMDGWIGMRLYEQHWVGGGERVVICEKSGGGGERRGEMVVVR